MTNNEVLEVNSNCHSLTSDRTSRSDVNGPVKLRAVGLCSVSWRCRTADGYPPFPPQTAKLSHFMADEIAEVNE